MTCDLIMARRKSARLTVTIHIAACFVLVRLQKFAQSAFSITCEKAAASRPFNGADGAPLLSLFPEAG